LRTFIAALIPEEIRLEMKRYIMEMKPHWEGVKWENHEKLHLTLKFLGEVEESKIERIKIALEGLVRIYSPFRTAISRFGGFPSLKNPRVLFIGLSENHELLRLQCEIEERLEGFGFKKESRTFVSHVTIGRIRGRARSKGFFPIPQHTSFPITEIALMKSVLYHEGSKHTPISLFQLEAVS
jgi:2'-5' RNA ligase